MGDHGAVCVCEVTVVSKLRSHNNLLKVRMCQEILKRQKYRVVYDLTILIFGFVMAVFTMKRSISSCCSLVCVATHGYNVCACVSVVDNYYCL